MVDTPPSRPAPKDTVAEHHARLAAMDNFLKLAKKTKSPEVDAAWTAGDTELVWMLVYVLNGCWAYPAPNKELKTQDIETVKAWHAQKLAIGMLNAEGVDIEEEEQHQQDEEKRRRWARLAGPKPVLKTQAEVIAAMRELEADKPELFNMIMEDKEVGTELLLCWLRRYNVIDPHLVKIARMH